MRPGTVGGSPAAMWYPVTFSWVRTSEPEDKRSLERTRAAAAQGDVKAQFAMATLYAYRAATDPSARAEQLDWLRKAAEGKLAMAQMHLGAAYELGIGVAQDEKEALRWYELAAAQGNVLAIERLRLGGIPSTVGPVPF
jgi:TPR repeat protein